MKLQVISMEEELAKFIQQQTGEPCEPEDIIRVRRAKPVGKCSECSHIYVQKDWLDVSPCPKCGSRKIVFGRASVTDVRTPKICNSGSGKVG